MVVVVMEPGSERLSTLVLGLIAAGVGPSVGHGAVEPLDSTARCRTPVAVTAVSSSWISA
jgi:hypothetical protein